MIKPKVYDVEDSNVAGLGGEDHKKLVKETAVKGEPAWKRWKEYLNGQILKKADEAKKDSKGCLHHCEIWRIEKFKVKFWPRESFGKFHSGDSYIILHTYEVKEDGQEKICWDLHFWLGKDTTQDEMGTAAYKTVELDTVLEDGPVQMREVEGYESDKFMAIFSDIYKCGGIRYLEGGVDSGFRHVEAEKYEPKLFHLKGNKKKVRCNVVKMTTDSLNAGDIFVLDTGLKIYSWKGGEAGMFERNKGRELADALKVERRGKAQIVFLNQGDFNDPDYQKFLEMLGGNEQSYIKTAAEGGSDDAEPTYGPNSLWKLSDASGSLTFSQVGQGELDRTMLDPNDVFICDAGHTLFAWCGSGSNENEKSNAIPYATQYLSDHGKPMHTPIVRILEGKETKEFKAVVNM